MKTKFYFVLIFLLTYIIIGCQEDPVLVPDPEPIAKSSFTVSVLPAESVAYNTTIDIKVVAENLTYWKLNGKIINSNLFQIPELVKDTILNFYAFGDDNQEWDTTIVVKVAEPPVPPIYVPTRTDTLCSRYWMLVNEKYFSNGVWNEPNLSTEELTTKSYYKADGTYHEYAANGRTIGAGTWAWCGPDSILWNGQTKPEMQYFLTDTTFIKSVRNNTIIMFYRGYPIN